MMNGGTGQEKVVLKVSGIKDLQEIKRHAIDLNLPWSEVTDAGHTQICSWDYDLYFNRSMLLKI